jgi:AraC family transcriptional regulator
MKLQTGEYLGEYATERVINGLLITRSYHLQYNKISWHHHTNPYYSFVLEGKYNELYNKKTVSLKKGDVVFHPSQTVHSNVFDNLNTTCLNIEFSNQWFQKYNIDPSRIKEQPLVNDAFQRTLLCKLAHEMKDPDEFSEMSILGIAAELSRAIIKEPKEKTIPAFLQKIKFYIDQNQFSNITLHQLHQLTNISEEHICREFKSRFSITLGEYIRQKKVEKSCQLLHRKSIPIEEVAFELGFTDAPHFSKTFKKVMGISPSIYRSSL